jgi:hypothetical protein
MMWVGFFQKLHDKSGTSENEKNLFLLWRMKPNWWVRCHLGGKLSISTMEKNSKSAHFIKRGFKGKQKSKGVSTEYILLHGFSLTICFGETD